MADRSGVDVTAWVKIGDRATIDYHLCEDEEVEFYIGGPDRFVLVTTERGLRNLVDGSREALHAVQAAAARTDEGCPTA